MQKSCIKQKSSVNIGFCQQFHIWITTSHIPGKENFVADFESRREYKDAEWMVNPNII